MQALVSVVVPAWNRAGLIAASVRSILDQSWRELEVIVVDDGSQDDTAAIVRSIGDARLRVLANSRAKGAQGARNTGILAARGEWIAFNDSDDEWRPGKLARQMEALRSRNFSPDLVVHGDAVKYALPRTEGKARAALLLRPSPMFQAMLVHRSSLDAIGLLDESLPAYQEWDTAIRLAERCAFIHLEEPLFVYRVGEAGAISGDARRGIAAYAQVVRKHAAAIVAHHGYAGLRRHFQWLIRRAVSFGALDLAAELRAEAIERARISGLRRSLLERSSTDGGAFGAIAHRLAQIYDRLLPAGTGAGT